METTDFTSVSMGILMLLFCLFGLCGNFLTILVYTRKPLRKTSINILITGLAFVDILLLCSSFFIGAMQPLATSFGTNFHFLNFLNEATFYLYPLCCFTQSASLGIQASISVERYIAVCYPLRAPSMCTAKSAVLSLLLVLTGAGLFNIVRIYEYKLVDVLYRLNGSDNASMTITMREMEMLLRKDGRYVLWYCTVGYLAIHITPSLLVCILSGAILCTLYVQPLNNGHHAGQCAPKERNTAAMMICVIISSALTYGFYFAVSIFEVMNLEIFKERRTLSIVMIDFSNALILFNSANSAAIYAAFSRKYRRVSRRILRQICCRTLNREHSTLRLFASSISDIYRRFLSLFASRFEGCESAAVARRNRGYRLTKTHGDRSKRFTYRKITQLMQQKNSTSQTPREMQEIKEIDENTNARDSEARENHHDVLVHQEEGRENGARDRQDNCA